MILPDNETKVDLLNNEAIAKTIVKLLRKLPDHPVTVGVHGDWGAGKSSVLEMIEVALNAEDKVLCLKFNGWRFQGFEDAKIALIEGIVTGLIEKRPTLTKAAPFERTGTSYSRTLGARALQFTTAGVKQAARPIYRFARFNARLIEPSAQRRFIASAMRRRRSGVHAPPRLSACGRSLLAFVPASAELR
jgi:predicted KAP-like P-loop ATPase